MSNSIDMERLKKILSARNEGFGCVFIREYPDMEEVVIDDRMNLNEFITFIKECHACFPVEIDVKGAGNE